MTVGILARYCVLRLDTSQVLLQGGAAVVVIVW